MKVVQDHATSSKAENVPSEEGKTMSPPSFQLTASPADSPSAPPPASDSNGNFSGESEKGAPTSDQYGQVIQRQELEGEHCNDNVNVPEAWINFADAFNKEFASILHVFKNESCKVEGEGESSDVGFSNAMIGEASGNPVSAESLSKLFTTGQRDKIMDFISSRNIPERLFNGDDVGSTTAQQRLLMAGHILSTGKYSPGSFDQKVHARMCWHWVHITHDYAGAATDVLNVGMMGTADHNNDIVLGQGKTTTKFQEKRVLAEDLPQEYDEERNLGPIPSSTSHEGAISVEQNAIDSGKKSSKTVGKISDFPFEDFGKIEPGDWIWSYNANSSAVGSHSLIFSRWVSGDLTSPSGVRYRKAICFSQPFSKTGGKEHYINLGEKYTREGGVKIDAISYVTSVSPDTNPARTVDELVPKQNEKAEARLSKVNEAYIKNEVEKHYKKPVDREKLAAKLRRLNSELIDSFGPNITAGQRELLNEANSVPDIETLIRLYQKLKTISHNYELLESADIAGLAETEVAYKESANKLAETEAQIDLAEADILARKMELDSQKAFLEAELLDAIDERDELDTKPEFRVARQKYNTLNRAIRATERKNKKDTEFLTTDPELLYMREQREQLSLEVEKWEKLGLLNRKDLQKKISEINKLKKEIRAIPRKQKTLDTNFKKQEDSRAEAQEGMPYNVAHRGQKDLFSNARPNGILKKVFSISDFGDLLSEDVPEKVE